MAGIHEIQTMPNIVFNEEWVVEAKLCEKTGLSKRQVSGYRNNRWIEGIHFKRVIQTQGDDNSSRATVWYNYPQINHFVQEA